MVYFRALQNLLETKTSMYLCNYCPNVALTNGRAQITPQMETMLLTHMFALCLRLDDYATDTTLIAKDLSMPVVK